MARAPLKEAMPPASLCDGQSFESVQSQRTSRDSKQRERSPLNDVTPRISDNTIRWSSQMRPYTQLISHRPTDNQQRRWEARKVSDEVLKVQRVLVIAEDVVPQA